MHLIFLIAGGVMLGYYGPPLCLLALNIFTESGWFGRLAFVAALLFVVVLI